MTGHTLLTVSKGEGPEAVPGPGGWERSGGLKTFRCGDVVPGCGQAFEGSEARVVDLACAHGEREHALRRTPELVEAVRRAMRPA